MKENSCSFAVSRRSYVVGTVPVLNKANLLSASQSQSLLHRNWNPGINGKVRNGTYCNINP